MPVTSRSFALSKRSVFAGAAALALASAAAVTTLSPSQVSTTLASGIAGMKTVAAMLAERSPGERPEGALASLKPKKQQSLHARALPKVRAPAPAATPFAAVAGLPPAPAAVPPAAPLFSTVTALPPVLAPGATAGPGTPGGPAVFPAISPPPGGGVVVPPPVVPETPGSPGTPGTPGTPGAVPAVPEPASWAMMLLGFAMIGGMVRRERALRRSALL